MRARPAITGLIFSVSITCCYLVLGGRPHADADNAPLPRGILTFRLATDKSVYQANESIKIRLSILNNAVEDYAIPHVPPYALCDLKVWDDKNDVLRGKVANAPGYSLGGLAIKYPAGTMQVLSYQWSSLEPRVYWFPLSYWGYELKQPGIYTIRASAKFTTWSVGGGPHFSFLGDSNSARIKIAD